MKRIISASYKDDTPAFFAEEFFENVEKGVVDLKTKYGTSHISLKPEDVYCYNFWTKNCSDYFIEHLPELQNPFMIQWTIDGYGKDLEPNVQDKHEILERFKRVSEQCGRKNVFWRYDPILISDKYNVQYHIRAFKTIRETFKGYTDRCIISFFDEYGKLKKEIESGIMRAPTLEEIHEICAAIAPIAKENDMRIQTCSEGKYDLTEYGIKNAPCIDAEYIENELGVPLPDKVKVPNTFRDCACAANTDIGQYHRCMHDCKFCYAK